MDPDLRNPPRRVRSPFGIINTDGYEARLRHNSDESVDVQQFTTPPGALTDDLAGLGAGALTNGAYTYRVTFVTAGGETEGGTVSGGVTVADATTNGQVALTAIPVSPNPQVTSRNIYRTIAGGAAHLLQSTIADNTTTTLTDNTADAALTTAAPTVNTARDTTYTLDPAGNSLLGTDAYKGINTSMRTARGYRRGGNRRANTGIVVGTVGVIFFTPFIVPVAMTLDRIGVSCTVGVATSAARLGIFRSGGRDNPFPQNLLLDAGTVSLAVAGEQAISISQVLTPGLYWFAFFGGVAAATVGAISANEEGLTALICGTSAAALTSDCTSTVTQALAFAALPATATPVANINGAANPNVAVRRSA